MDLRLLARFPFFREATDLVRERKVELEDLLTSIAYEDARERGGQRVLDALEKGEIGDYPMGTELDQFQEILSYPLSRMLVSCVADPFLVRRYSLAEAVTMNRRLREEGMGSIQRVAGELGVKASVTEEGLTMRFTDYLRYTSRIRSREWKLVNNEIHQGYVHLSQARFCRVLQQAFQEGLEEELPLEVSDRIVTALEATSNEIGGRVRSWKEKFQAEDLGRVSIVRFPPCMKRMVGMAQAGENLPHTGRFALVSFLHFIGLSAEDILNLFSSSPDFDASKSRYQIEHITGEVSGTEYTPPECSTMKSYGLCPEPDRLCRHAKVNHPLTYYRIKGRPRKKEESKEESEKD